LKFLKDLLFISTEEKSFLEIVIHISSKNLDTLAETIFLLISPRSSFHPWPGTGGRLPLDRFCETPIIFFLKKKG
jgi:hypothetical protein